MELRCPKCGNTDFRLSRSKDGLERFLKRFDIRAVRCRKCGSRMLRPMWTWNTLQFARCPKCFAMDLNRWTETEFNAPNYMLILLKLGWNPYRCEYCRHNFISIRRRRERFNPKVSVDELRRRDAQIGP